MNITAPHEGILLKQLKCLFPTHSTRIHARKVTNIKFPHTGAYVELDIWIPTLNLSFEFQDPHHYVTTWYTAKSLDTIQQRDRVKEGLVRNHGITLVIVPCWWDGDLESLEAEIDFYRPDLSSVKAGLPITLNPRRSLQSFEVPGVGELMSALFPVDANFNSIIHPNTWWLGEKYDGVRFCWNPHTRKAFCNPLFIHPKIRHTFPKLFIDGEIWFGRGKFSFASNLANRYEHIDWELLRLVSFDVPAFESQTKPFEDRYASLLANIYASTHLVMIVAPRMMCQNTQHLKTTLQDIIERDGEGIILRRKGSLYANGKSSALIKFKSSQAEKEAIVVAIKDKAVQVALPCSTTFTIPPNDVLVPTPSIGDVVTFSFENRARRDVPLNPKLIKIRTDIVWEEVVLNFHKERKLLNESSHKVEGITTHPNWSIPFARSYLEKIARSRKMNPLLPDTYYRLHGFLIQSSKGRSFLHKFKGGYIHTLQRLFPDLEFDHNAFCAKWFDVRNRRKIFEEFARQHKFDPLRAPNWYLVPVSRLLAMKGIATVITYHDQSVHKALLSLFPEIGLEPHKFLKNVDPRGNKLAALGRPDNIGDFGEDRQHLKKETPQTARVSNQRPLKSDGHGTDVIGVGDWTSIKSRRRFFENHAFETGCDPLNPHYWYSQNYTRMMSLKGAAEISSLHSFSLRQALLDLFPDIGLDSAKLIKNIWNDADRKLFFEEYAQSKGFDPLNPSNWYSQPLSPILELPGASQVMKPYGRSIRKALISLFPNIGLDLSKFYRYEEVENRRRFFEEYAKRHGFDAYVPDNWYKFPLTLILSATGAQQIIRYYNHSVKQALVSLFPDIGLDLLKFRSAQNGGVEKSKIFFENYALANRFDLKNPQNWYSQSLRRIISSKGVSAIMLQYKGNVPKALIELFPDVGFDPLKFQMTT